MRPFDAPPAGDPPGRDSTAAGGRDQPPPDGGPAASPSSSAEPPAAELSAAEREILERWLASCGWPGCTLEGLAGDVGGRRYLRATRSGRGSGSASAPTSAVVALYPADLRSACRRFGTSTRLLEGVGVRVPRILAQDCAEGRMLVEDLGERTFDHWARDRDWDEVGLRFRQAARVARRIADLDPGTVGELSPPLDRQLLLRELALSRESFLDPEGLSEGDLDRSLRAGLHELVEAIAAVPVVPCHRDFMVRNLMPWEDGVAVLDHQDLRLGPPLYDLASLLNDTLFPPPELEEELLEAGGAVSPEGRLEYHRVSAQRTLKAVGSYAMAARRGKRHHVERIAPTFERALRHLAAVPETADLSARLGERWRRPR